MLVKKLTINPPWCAFMFRLRKDNHIKQRIKTQNKITNSPRKVTTGYSNQFKDHMKSRIILKKDSIPKTWHTCDFR
jgi:hypothetical protein